MLDFLLGERLNTVRECGIPVLLCALCILRSLVKVHSLSRYRHLHLLIPAGALDTSQTGSPSSVAVSLDFGDLIS